jgi:hypothetical protein
VNLICQLSDSWKKKIKILRKNSFLLSIFWIIVQKWVCNNPRIYFITLSKKKFKVSSINKYWETMLNPVRKSMNNRKMRLFKYWWKNYVHKNCSMKLSYLVFKVKLSIKPKKLINWVSNWLLYRILWPLNSTKIHIWMMRSSYYIEKILKSKIWKDRSQRKRRTKSSINSSSSKSTKIWRVNSLVLKKKKLQK